MRTPCQPRWCSSELLIFSQAETVFQKSAGGAISVSMSLVCCALHLWQYREAWLEIHHTDCTAAHYNSSQVQLQQRFTTVTDISAKLVNPFIVFWKTWSSTEHSPASSFHTTSTRACFRWSKVQASSLELSHAEDEGHVPKCPFKSWNCCCSQRVKVLKGSKTPMVHKDRNCNA